MTTGNIIFLPRKIPHTWVQLSDEGKMLYMLQPSGSFEDFLRELQAFPHPPSEAELQQIHIKHGMKVLAPPLKA